MLAIVIAFASCQSRSGQRIAELKKARAVHQDVAPSSLCSDAMYALVKADVARVVCAFDPQVIIAKRSDYADSIIYLFNRADNRFLFVDFKRTKI